jgi:RNA polymerase sigma factor (sigma-70 family)
MNANSTSLMQCLRKLVAPPSCADVPDPQLLERFLTQRSEAAFAALVRRHGPMVLSVCRRVLHHTQDAEDAFQATFLVLARKAGSIRKRESVGSWLHGVAYRVSRMSKNKETRRRAHQRGMPQQQPADARDDIHWHELRLVLDEELRKLPEKYRAPLVLCYLEGRTRDEAAKQLGVSKAVFRRRLEYGRDQLGRQLARRGLTLSAALSAPLLADAAMQAALPPLLLATTVRAGLASALGNAVCGILSNQVIALAESGVGSLLAKKASIALVLLLSLTLGIGSLLAHRTSYSRTFAEAPPASSPLSPLARSASKDQAVEIKGRVLDPDGKPLAGARLFLLSDAKKAKGDVVVRATTDKDGRFSFTAEPPVFNAEGKVTLAATAKGFGPAWIDVMAEKRDTIPLQLVKDDVPIEGRVLDLEGQPIPGVTVYASRLMQTNLNALFDARRRGQFSWLPGIELEKVNQAISCKTDKDGRFHLEGFGRDRVVFVHMRGEKTANRDVDIVTRREVPRELSKDHYDVYPARFDYVVGPSKPILGTVRDKRTGKPLAGVTVGFGMTRPWILTTTDEQGRYRLEGVGKRQSYFVAAGGVSFTSAAKFDLADTPGLDPVIADFEIERGIAVRGRLLDKATGKPVQGRVLYAVLNDNPHLKDFATLNTGFSMVDGRTSADGSFAVTAIPGPGLLCAMADDVERFCGAEINKPWKTNATLYSYHAVVPIDPDEKDAKPVVQDILLEPGRTLKGSVIDLDGIPLNGAFAAGRRPVTWFDSLGSDGEKKLKSDSFTVGGLKSGHPRPLLFFHPESKLGKLLRLGGDEKGPLVVRLEPLGALSGRVVDAQGHPLANLKVIVEFDWRDLSAASDPRDAEKSLPREMTYEDPLWKAARRNTSTDREGNFCLEGLIPGVRYKLYVGGEELRPGALHLARFEVDGLTVETGKTKDLGDLKNKQMPDK